MAGRIIAPSEFYKLESLDKTGILWRVERTLPTIDPILVGGRHFKLVNGKACEISFTRSYAKQDISLTIVFFTDERVPRNAPTEVTTKAPDGSITQSSRLDTVQFSTTFGNFNIYNRPGMLVVKVVGQKPFPAHFETRIVEVLGLVLAKPLRNVIERHENATETVRVHGGWKAVDAKLQPPIISGTIDLSGGDVWRLFDKYLTLIYAYTDDGFHPCSRHVFSVLEAMAGAISARAVALGVAVEGIVKDLFPDAGALPPTLKPVVRRLRNTSALGKSSRTRRQRTPFTTASRRCSGKSWT